MKIQIAFILSLFILASCGNSEKSNQKQESASSTQLLPFSPAVVANGTLYISGQIAPAKAGETKSIEQETKEVMEKIGAILEENGYSFDDVVRCSVFLACIDDYQAVNKVYASFYNGKFPSRVAMEVSKLVKGSQVEISAIAVRQADVVVHEVQEL